MPNLTIKKEKTPTKKDAGNKVAIEVAEILQNIIGKDLKSFEEKHLNRVIADLQKIFQNNNSEAIKQSVNAIVDSIVEFNAKQGKEIGDAVETMKVLHDSTVRSAFYGGKKLVKIVEIIELLCNIHARLTSKKEEMSSVNPANETSLGPDELKKHRAGNESATSVDVSSAGTLLNTVISSSVKQNISKNKPSPAIKKEKIPDKKDDVLYNADAENKVAIEVAEILQSIIGKDLKSFEEKHLNRVIADLQKIFQNNDSEAIKQSVNAIVDSIVEFNAKQGKEIGNAVETMKVLYRHTVMSKCYSKNCIGVIELLCNIQERLASKKEEMSAANPLNETSLGPDELKKHRAGNESATSADVPSAGTLLDAVISSSAKQDTSKNEPLVSTLDTKIPSSIVASALVKQNAAESCSGIAK